MPELPDHDDLVIKSKTDQTAFGLLYDSYYAPVMHYCMRRLFDRATAEDVVADVFLNVAENIKSFIGRTQQDFRRWLFRLATNAVNAHLRQTHRRRTLLEAAVRSGACNRVGAAHVAGPGDGLDWPLVYQAILELDERDQTILVLRFYSACSHEDIAQIIGATSGAVRTALSRTLARLRAKFNPSAPSEQVLDKLARE